MKGCVIKTDPRYILINLYMTIHQVWQWKMVVWHILSWDVYSYSKLYKRVTAKSYGLNRLDGTITGVQNIHWTEHNPVHIMETRQHAA